MTQMHAIAVMLAMFNLLTFTINLYLYKCSLVICHVGVSIIKCPDNIVQPSKKIMMFVWNADQNLSIKIILRYIS